ncbi:alditol oxidase [soil metagenome]
MQKEVAVSVGAPSGGTESGVPPMRNWAGNIRFEARGLHRPRSVRELQHLVAHAERLRALGTGHSFNAIADTAGPLVSVADLPQLVEVDSVGQQVRVGAGLRYGDLGPALRGAGLALPNTGSLPHISIAGSCATGTHGAGAENRLLAASVSSVTLVGADGDLLTVDRESDGDDFDGFVVSLGRLGIVVELVLDLVPEFEVAQTVVEDVDNLVVADQLVPILTAAYSVSVFTDWRADRATHVWLKEKVGRDQAWDGVPLLGGRLADGPRHPIRGMPTEFATPQLGVPGPWDERLPHFRLDFTPSSGQELQSEYVVPVAAASSAWRAVSSVAELVAPALQVCEVRAIAADPMWLSTTGGGACVAFHFTWSPEPEAVLSAVTAVEDQLAGFGARPHWAKVFTTSNPALAGLYPRMGDFRRLVSDLDPSSKFGNDLVDGWIGLQ